MKQIRLIFRAAALAAVCVLAVSCGGSFIDPGVLDADSGTASGGSFGGKRGTEKDTVRGELDTAAGEPTRTKGFATDGEKPPLPAGWPPQWDINILFPATQNTPGFLGLSGHGTVKETGWSQLEKDVVWEINKFRADPVGWCNKNGLPYLDGISAHAEFLGSGPRRGSYNFPAQPLYPSQGLHKAALHQTLFGNVAHSDGSRVSVYVGYSGWGENVGHYAVVNQASGGATAAAKIVNEFIRDRGVPGKGHRINIANPAWDRVGIACYNNIIVMQFGKGIGENNP